MKVLENLAKSLVIVTVVTMGSASLYILGYAVADSTYLVVDPEGWEAKEQENFKQCMDDHDDYLYSCM